MRSGWATGLRFAIALAGCLATVSASATPSEAEPVELHGAHVSIVRSANAAECPGQAAILDRVRHHLAEGGGEPEGPLVITATIAAEASELVARIVVSGHREGQRTLRAEGPGCEELADALAVSLALILDGTMAESLEPIIAEPAPEPAPAPTPSPEPESERPPAPTPAPAFTPSPPLEPRPSVTGWFAAGGAVTHGVPDGLSGAVTAKLGAEYGRFSLALAAFLAPTVTLPHQPGSVDVRLVGGTLHGCGRLAGQNAGLRLDACAVAGYGALRGSARNYPQHTAAVRPWRALGGAAMVRGKLLGPLGWGTGATLLAPVVHEQFSIEGVDHVDRNAYSTPPIAVFGSAELWVRFL